MTNPLQLTIAKLELKQLEMIDKLSEKHSDYVIRLIQSSITDKFIMVNGDWELITGFKESYCSDKGWEDLLPQSDLKKMLKQIDLTKSNSELNSFKTNLLMKSGKTITVNWKCKYFPEINGLIFIGRVKRY
jgi:PAS domain S-box-containing protein